MSLRKMGPLTDGHPLLEEDADPCPGCRSKFSEGEYVTLITIGPGDDPEARRRAVQGRAYTAVALPVHWACAVGEF